MIVVCHCEPRRAVPLVPPKTRRAPQLLGMPFRGLACLKRAAVVPTVMPFRGVKVCGSA
ncbi:MAG: hypothetical protein WCL34_13120 [Methylococcaceae bacterium]